MNKLLAKHISPGMRIGIVSVSAPEAAIESERFERGRRVLEKRGYRVHVAPSVLGRHGYLSAPERDLASDLNSAFRNSEIDAIICSGGGTNSNRLLRHIDFDAIKANPKIFMGISNPSTILNAIYARTGLVTFHGPVVVWNFGEPNGVNAYTEENLWPMLETTWKRREIQPEPSWRWFRSGKALGPLVGGNLISVEALLGTPYEPAWDGAVFFWEDIAKPFNRLDLMLTHFRDAGVFNRISAMVVGRLVACDEPEGGLSFAQMLSEVLEGTDFPILLDVSLGHTAEKLTLPIGAQVELDTANARFSIIGPVTT